MEGFPGKVLVEERSVWTATYMEPSLALVRENSDLPDDPILPPEDPEPDIRSGRKKRSNGFPL